MKRYRLKKRIIDRVTPRLARQLQSLATQEGIEMQVFAEPANGQAKGTLVLSGPGLHRLQFGDWQTAATGTISRLLAQLKGREGDLS